MQHCWTCNNSPIEIQPWASQPLVYVSSLASFSKRNAAQKFHWTLNTWGRYASPTKPAKDCWAAGFHQLYCLMHYYIRTLDYHNIDSCTIVKKASAPFSFDWSDCDQADRNPWIIWRGSHWNGRLCMWTNMIKGKQTSRNNEITTKRWRTTSMLLHNPCMMK